MARRIEIPKKGGRVRVVYALSARERQAADQLAADVWAAALACAAAVDRLAGYPVAHAMPGRSVVTQARLHRQFSVTASADLKDYYDCLFIEDVARAAGAAIADRCRAHVLAVDRSLPSARAAVQGSPAAPAIGELVGASIDARALDWLRLRAGGRRWVYTRYCDDLSLSCDCERLARDWIAALPQIVAPFDVATQKTTVQHARNGRRVICGVAVGDAGQRVAPPRRVRRVARAAAHAVACALLDAWRADCAAADELRDLLLVAGAAHLRRAAGLAEWVAARAPDRAAAAVRLAARGAEWMAAARAVVWMLQ